MAVATSSLDLLTKTLELEPEIWATNVILHELPYDIQKFKKKIQQNQKIKKITQKNANFGLDLC